MFFNYGLGQGSGNQENAIITKTSGSRHSSDRIDRIYRIICFSLFPEERVKGSSPPEGGDENKNLKASFFIFKIILFAFHPERQKISCSSLAQNWHCKYMPLG
jgi:hypothetical protein